MVVCDRISFRKQHCCKCTQAWTHSRTKESLLFSSWGPRLQRAAFTAAFQSVPDATDWFHTQKHTLGISAGCHSNEISRYVTFLKTVFS